MVFVCKSLNKKNLCCVVKRTFNYKHKRTLYFISSVQLIVFELQERQNLDS